jgi:cyclopropane-fatty-acyl-phospholipid synthase
LKPAPGGFILPGGTAKETVTRAATMFLSHLLSHAVRTGTLHVTDAHGARHTFGDGTPPTVSVALHDPKLHWLLLLRPRVTAGEAYMDGRLTMETGTLFDLMDLVCRDHLDRDWPLATRLIDTAETWLRPLQQFNPVRRSHANVAHHYDLSGALYDLFLDQDRQYSCAYFAEPHDDIDRAQRDKKRRIAAKLLLQPGHRVLDIGCGWGGMALMLARDYGCAVTGLTLSREQHDFALQRVKDAGLEDKIEIRLEDYRVHDGTYDRIVSVGMFEHVGLPFYPTYFRRVREMLKPDGVAVLHTIGRLDGPGATDSWIRKYIFPGGYSPALSEVTGPIERQRLLMTDVEILRLHYAETLRLWRERFLARRDEAAQLYDERFVRMWEYYLAASEVAFRHLGHAVFQIQMARRNETVPITRSYMTLDGEAAAAPASRAVA